MWYHTLQVDDVISLDCTVPALSTSHLYSTERTIMCVQLVERYAGCDCLYYEHDVDPCSAKNTLGHEIQIRVVPIGYTCSQHRSPPLEYMSPYELSQEAQTDRDLPIHQDQHDLVRSTDVYAELNSPLALSNDLEHPLPSDNQIDMTDSRTTSLPRTPRQRDTHLPAVTPDEDSNPSIIFWIDHVPHGTLHPSPTRKDIQKHDSDCEN